eukprot:sb/3479601/
MAQVAEEVPAVSTEEVPVVATEEVPAKEEVAETEEDAALREANGAVAAEIDSSDPYASAVSETGEINWECPCLVGLATEGPCIEEFKAAFSCWLYSTSDQEGGSKGDDCHDNFLTMTVCMSENEEFYDDLNARNKAAAEAARSEYEAEEQARLDAASMDQLIAVEDLAIEDGQIPVAIEDGTTLEQTLKVVSLPSEEQTTPVAKAVSLPSEPYQSERLEMVGNSSALVAAASEEEEGEKVAESEGSGDICVFNLLEPTYLSSRWPRDRSYFVYTVFLRAERAGKAH